MRLRAEVKSTAAVLDCAKTAAGGTTAAANQFDFRGSPIGSRRAVKMIHHVRPSDCGSMRGSPPPPQLTPDPQLQAVCAKAGKERLRSGKPILRMGGMVCFSFASHFQEFLGL
jgi:hypothetical protein